MRTSTGKTTSLTIPNNLSEVDIHQVSIRWFLFSLVHKVSYGLESAFSWRQKLADEGGFKAAVLSIILFCFLVGKFFRIGYFILTWVKSMQTLDVSISESYAKRTDHDSFENQATVRNQRRRQINSGSYRKRDTVKPVRKLLDMAGIMLGTRRWRK